MYRVRRLLRPVSRLFSSISAPSAPMTTISRTVYISDVEGNISFWNNFKRTSTAFKNQETLELADDCRFVFGGDVCDRGTGDLRIIKELVSLKKKYPDRVHFILGNRDVNKIRMYFELHPHSLKCFPQAYWIRQDALACERALEVDPNICSVVSRVQWMLKSTMGSPVSFECRKQEISEILSGHPLYRDKLDQISDEVVAQSYLDLMDPKFFGIKTEVDPNTTSISEFLASEFGGYLVEYLYLGQLALRVQDMVVVHGAVNDLNFGFVPPRNGLDQFTKIEESTEPIVDRWIDALNAFCRKEIEDFIQSASKFVEELECATPDPLLLPSPKHWAAVGGYSHPQPGSRLLQYGMGWLADRSVNPSIIYATFIEQGIPKPLAESVATTLKREGVSIILSGHQPHGDAPFPFVLESTAPIHQLNYDTSYSINMLWSQFPDFKTAPENANDRTQESGSETWRSLTKAEVDALFDFNLRLAVRDPSSYGNPGDTRGIAVGEIVASHPPDSSGVSIRSFNRLSNGLVSEMTFEPSAPSLVGREVEDGWFVKSACVKVPPGFIRGLPEGTYCLLCKGAENFQFKNKLVPLEKLHAV